jgi:hypothetical protein
MATPAGGGDAPATITITEGGVTVEVRPLGWTDYWTLDRDLDAIALMPQDDEAAVVEACLDIARRMDAYAVGPARPSSIPSRHVRAFVARWVAEVRDAAVPPPSAVASRKRRRTA